LEINILTFQDDFNLSLFIFTTRGNMKTKLLFISILSMLLLTGCMTHTVTAYSPSFDNINHLQSLKKANQTISLGNFTATVPNQRSIACRAEGMETLPNNQTYEQYIQNALQNELSSVGLLSNKSRVVLNGNLDKVDFDSVNGRWIIQMTFNSNVNDAFTVSSTAGFDTSFIADMACEEVAKSFAPAVQTFLDKLYADPNFKNLLRYHSA
jgi:HAMP domain-containing protein